MAKAHSWKLTSTDYPTTHTCQNCGATLRCYARRDVIHAADGKKLRRNSACPGAAK